MSELEIRPAGTDTALPLNLEKRLRAIEGIAGPLAGRTILDTRGTWDRGEWTEAGFQFIALGVGESKAHSSS